jgi:hypothetical protein
MSAMNLLPALNGCINNRMRFARGRKLVKLGAILVTGLALAAIPMGPARANLVNDSNFATGTFTGWVASDPSVVIDSTFTPPYNSDAYDAEFTGSGTLSQSITTTPGVAYVLAFSLLDESGAFTDQFTIKFGGLTALITGNNAATYQQELISVPGSDITSSHTTLTFQATTTPISAWNLDDVSIVSAAVVPEPPMGAIFAAAVLALAAGRRRGGLFLR